MSVETLVVSLEALGVRLWEQEGQLHFRAPEGVMSQERLGELRHDKQAVLVYLRRAASPIAIEGDRQARYDPFPLTDVQAAYLLGRRDAFDYGGVACQVYGEVAFPELSPERLEAAWRVLVHRHDMLRAVIHSSGHQRVLEQVPEYRIRVADLRGASPADLAAVVQTVRGEMDHRFYQPDEWPLFELRATLGYERALLHFSIDFLIADYLSIQRLLDELVQLYADPALVLPPLEIGFRDYVLADRRLREGGRYERDREYWQERIDALPAAPELPVLDQSAATGPARFRRYQLTIPSEGWAALRRRAGKRKITPSGAVLAAYAEVVGRWSRRAQFMLNLTLLNRQALHPQVGELVGDFTTVSLLEVDRAASVSFHTRAQELQAQLWQDIDHRLFSGVEVMREIARRRGRAAALMPVIFTSTIGLGDESDAPLEGELVFGLSQTPQVWIDCQAVERDGELVVSWDVRAGVFPDGLAQGMFSALGTLLEGLAEDDAPWELHCPVALPAAQRERRERANDTARAMPGGLLHGGFLAQALRSPERPAVISRHRSLDYGELLAHATAVRDALKDAAANQGDMVAIVMDKGWEQIAAVLGTLLASAVYVPIDTTQPPARRGEMLDAARARVVLTQSWIADRTEWPAGTQAIAVDTLTPTTPEGHSLERCVQPDDLAYVIFTSGSSGKPKGVMMSHRGALNTIEDINRRFGVGARDRVFGLAHLGFDLSVYDIFGPLAGGGCIVLPDADRRGDPSHWAELVAAHTVTVWNSVPAQMQMLEHYLRATPDFELPSLRLALLSGDWIPVGLPNSIREQLTDLRVISLGGATEAGIWSIFHPIEEVPAGWRSIPYGKPLANQVFHVLDHTLQPSPEWTAGEIYIGGAGLAAGYLGDPERTAERFIEHPISGERLYRTGDFGRYLPDGSIEFLGREDRQVKIRGHRIELAEVEAGLQSHPAVAAAAALVDGRQPLERQLVAFVQAVRRTSEAPSERDGERVRDSALAAGEQATADDDRELFVEFVDALNRVALLEIVSALRREGLFATPHDEHTVDEVLERAGVIPQHKRLVRRWLAALEQEGLLARDVATDRYCAAPRLGEDGVADAWLGVEELLARGSYQPEVVQYLRRSSEHLPQLLRGEEDPLRLLFPEGRLDTAQATYGEYLIGRYINRVLTTTVTEIAAQTPTADPLRILEVGAGVGGTSAELIPALAGSHVEYQFSDVSQFFLNEAQTRFAEYPWVSYRPFDLNESYRAQELRPNSFEVIVAANVLHYAEHIGEALARLRELLTPGGWLVFVEATGDTHWIMASMELMETEGDFQDLRKGRDQTFLGREQWIELLTQAGADTTLCLPGAEHVLAPIGQHAFAARFKSDRVPLTLAGLNEHLAARLPEYMIPRHLQVVDSLPLSQNGKVDNATLRSWLPRHSAEQALVGGEPRDELERRLVEVWAEMLGVARVGRDHDFFELGGDSLLVSQVTARILEVVPEANGHYFDELMLRMLDEPRVAALAAFLREGPRLAEEHVRGSGDSQLIRLDSGDSDSALDDGGCISVLVHDELGTVAHYGFLAEQLARQGPVVGLTVNDTDAYLELDATRLVEHLASRYSKLISEAISHPLRIIGYSTGATLATEVARAAIEAGADVQELVLIDPQHIQCLLEDELAVELAFAHAVGIDPESLGFPAEELIAPAFDAAGNGDLKPVPAGTIAALADTTKTTSLQRLAQRPPRERLAAILRAAGALRPDLEASGDLAGCFDRFRQSLAATSQHRTQLYAGNIALLRPSEARSLPWQAQDPAEHWRGLCIGELRIVEIPGDHVGCLHEPHVERTAELVHGGQSAAAQIQ